MDDISVLASAAAVVGFLYTYIKDRHESGKLIGKLEERVARLEHRDANIESMSDTITELRVHLARIEQELSTVSQWVRNQQRNNNAQ